MARPKVSVIIPTYNRRELLMGAIETVLAQTVPVEEIIVVDDGSSDGTGEFVQRRFESRVTYIFQPNAGVSAARNRGLAMARGQYLALLDSDDEWLPEKTRWQVEFLDSHPDYGMVLCDVVRMTSDRKEFEIFRRREFIPEDGWALKWVLRNPALAPASVMFRREVYESVGGFNSGLRTAEDLEFHLRVARKWRIGVVSKPLVRAMRGHDGLSALSQTYDDYLAVMESFVAECRGDAPDVELDAGLSFACARNARGMLLTNRWREAARLAWRAFSLAPTWSIRREALRIAPLAIRRILAYAAATLSGRD